MNEFAKRPVAIFLPSLRGGGAERVMVTLANGIAGRGYSVDLVVALAEGPYVDHVSPQVRLVDLHARRVIKSLWPLARYLRHHQPIAMLSVLNYANLVAIMARQLSFVATRLVVSERNHISVEAQTAKTLDAKAVYTMVPKLYPKADVIHAVSSGVARDLEEFACLPVGSVKVIYNPFDLQRIEHLAREPVRHEWLAPGQPPVILGVGRLTEQKDFATLIRAFAIVRSRHKVRLMVLGEGELRRELELLAKAHGLNSDDFLMPGFVPNPYAYLSRSALFVLSSRWEGLPGVLIEAMACGTPVVSTDCPSGPREILEDGRWGRLVPVGDVEALAKAIEEVLSTPREFLPEVRKRAQDFDENRAIDAYLSILGLPAYQSLH